MFAKKVGIKSSNSDTVCNHLNKSLVYIRQLPRSMALLKFICAALALSLTVTVAFSQNSTTPAPRKWKTSIFLSSKASDGSTSIYGVDLSDFLPLKMIRLWAFYPGLFLFFYQVVPKDNLLLDIA